MIIGDRNYTHKGLLYGVIPVYISELDSEAPYIREKHWFYAPLIVAADFIFGVFVLAKVIKNPMYGILITGEI